MTGQSFSLETFPAAGALPAVQITGSLRRRGPTLGISYALRGPLAELALPAPAKRPVRRHGLWEETCFEFFLAPRNSRHYWEFNLSPAGHWNVYRFAAYRQGMLEEPVFTSLPFSVGIQPDALLLSLDLALGRLIRADQVLEAAIAAVIKLRDGALTYWALTHPGPRPDFHQREGFILTLPGNS